MKRTPLIDLGHPSICLDCKRFKNSESPWMEGFGDGMARIMLLFDTVSLSDAERGALLSGDTGKTLSTTLERMGYDVENDFWMTAAVKCSAPTAVKPKHCQCCRELLLGELEILKPTGTASPFFKKGGDKPKGVLCFGANALRTLCPGVFSTYDASMLAGDVFPYKGLWVGVHESLQMMIANWHDKNYAAWFARALNQMLHKIDNSTGTPEIENPYDKVELITDFQQLKAFLRDVYRSKNGYAIDYETSGLNIHESGHHIWSMSMSPLNEDMAYAFAIDHPQGWKVVEQKELHDIMKHIFKKPRYWVAHNLQFEKPFTRGIFGVDPQFEWCTMIGAHLEDTREGRTGLKLQGALKYGIYGYDEESDLYKIPAKGEKFNRMHEMPLEAQLFYCGIDSWLTNKLWNDQQESLSYNLRGAKFFMKGANTFSDMTWNGMSLSLDHYKAARTELTKEITEIEQKILNSDEVKNYLRDNHLKAINLKSTPQLKEFFVDYLGCQVWKYTASGKASILSLL